jgi:hypothetical protein
MADRVQIIANDERGFRFGERVLHVEAVPVHFPAFPWVTTCCATPYIDPRTGEPTELWVITESRSGQYVGNSYKGRLRIARHLLASKTIEQAVEKAEAFLRESGITQLGWEELISRCEAQKQEKLKIIQTLR